jgi:tetratricopeptide (TPR) repeat protein
MIPDTRTLPRVPSGVWIFLIAFGFQFFVLWRISESRHFLPDGDDMKFYNDWARKLTGELQWKPREPNAPGTAFYGLPGYAYALAGIYSATGGYDHWYSPFLIGQLQVVFHAFTALFLFLIGRKAFSGESDVAMRSGTLIGIVAAIGWTLFTPAQIFTAILMPTSWVICAFWGLVYWLLCLETERVSWWRPWLWMGLAAGACAMVVATILMLIPLVILAIALNVGAGRPLRSRFASVAGAIAVLLAGVYAGCSPAWIHNYFFAKDPVLLSAHGGLNYYLGNHSTANGYTKIPTGLRASQEGLLRDSILIPEREAGRALLRSEVSKYWKSKGDEYVRNNRSSWMRLLGVKLANFWNSYQYDDLSILKLLRDEGVVMPGLRFGFAAAFGLPGLIFCAWRWPRSRWVAGGVLLHMAGLMTVFITERYRLAAVPGLLLLGAAGVVFLWEKTVSAAWPTVVAAVAVIAGAVWYVTIPRTNPEFWGLDFYKAGIRNTAGATEAMARASSLERQAADARKRGDDTSAGESASAAAEHRKLIPTFLDGAQRNLETALAYVPGHAQSYAELGGVWFLKQDYERARFCFETAIAIDPKNDSALNNLGTIALRQKRWAAAAELLTLSIQADPEDGQTWYSLATARRELGDKSGALEAVTNALRFEPNNNAFKALRDQLSAPAPSR